MPGLLAKRINYLRAWAYFNQTASEDKEELNTNQDKLPEGWFHENPQVMPLPRHTSATTSGVGTSTEQVDETAISALIPHTDFAEFKMGPPLGFGRCGTTFEATYHGDTVAVKLFDTNKGNGWEAFWREIATYNALQEAWGRLVPRPQFIAEAFVVYFLGLQKSEPPPENTPVEEWDSVLEELEKPYGFYHLDMEPPGRNPFHNRMMLRDKDTDRLQPIVIDLEDYELLVENPS